MAGEGELSKGYLARVNLKEKGLENTPLILQVKNINSLPNGKFGLNIHDCQNEMRALLNSSMNSLVQNNEMIVGTVIQVNQHNVNTIRGENIMIIHNLVVLQTKCESLAETPITMVPKPKPASNNIGGERPGFGGNAFGNNAFGKNKFQSNAFGNKPGFGANRSAVSQFYPIKSINPFMREFTIKARVTSKSGVRTWKNARGEGKLFNVVLMDAEGDEIQGTAFNDAVDRLFPIFEVSKVFIITKARAKMANRKYTHVTHQYSLELADAEVTPCADDGGINKFKFDFKPIANIASIDSGSFVDIIGICQKVGEIVKFTSKKGNDLTKRSFYMVDNSASNIECAIWGEEAQKFDLLNEGKVLCLQAAKVSDFGGRTLSVDSYYVEPDISKVPEVKSWWQQNQKTLSITSLTKSLSGGGSSPPITIDKASLLGKSEGADFFNVLVRFTRLLVKPDRNPWYNACPSEPDPTTQKVCKKKVVEGNEGAGTWYCASCDKHYNKYLPRYVLRAMVADHTGSLYVGLFDDQCKSILNKSASEAEELKQTDMTAYNNLFTKPVCKLYNARFRAKQETYNDEIRSRVDILELEELGSTQNMRNMYKEITELLTK